MSVNNSIAYLKQVWRDDTTDPDIVLTYDNSPCEIAYSDDMSIFFLIDEGDSFRFVLNSDLKQDKLTLEDLRQIGVANLRTVAAQIEIRKNDEYLFFLGNGNFEASLILLDEIWTDWLSEYCPNGYVAALPARDVLAVADKGRKESVAKLSALIERVWPNGDHLLSKSLYERRKDKWIRLENA